MKPANTPEEHENDMGGNYSRDVFIVSLVLYGIVGLMLAIAIAAVVWGAS